MPPKHRSQRDEESKHKEEQLPKNWPKDVAYLTDQTYSSAVTSDQRTALSRSTSESTSLARIPSELLRPPYSRIAIRTIEDESHPAHRQKGLFAACHLEPDSLICLYIGHVHTNSMSDTDPHSDYDLSYDRDAGLSIDAARSGCEARFSNDFRGIAERPNAEFRDCFIQVPSEKRKDGVKWERRVGVFVLSAGKAAKRKAGIKSDEEILVSYGKGFWEGRQMLAAFRKDLEMRQSINVLSATDTMDSLTETLK